MIENSREEIKMRTEFVPDSSCKICLESTPSEDLIHPCQCTGSVHYVHQECLKTWIHSNFVDIDSASCELCKHPFQMSYRIGLVCNINKFDCRSSFNLFSSLILLCIASGILFLIHNLLRVISQHKTDFILALLLVIASVCFFLNVVLAVYLIFKTFIVRQMKDLIIHNYRGPNSSSATATNSMKIESLEIPNTIVARGVRVVPPSVNIRSSKVRTDYEKGLFDSQIFDEYTYEDEDRNSRSVIIEIERL